MSECPNGSHDWKETGRRNVHCEFPTKTKGVRVLRAIYVRCAICDQPSFRQWHSPVVFTWPKDQKDWL